MGCNCPAMLCGHTKAAREKQKTWTPIRLPWVKERNK